MRLPVQAGDSTGKCTCVALSAWLYVALCVEEGTHTSVLLPIEAGDSTARKAMAMQLGWGGRR